MVWLVNFSFQSNPPFRVIISYHNKVSKSITFSNFFYRNETFFRFNLKKVNEYDNIVT
nr:MAG TPA: hypothetical protein [Caudoviricetes sp.]